VAPCGHRLANQSLIAHAKTATYDPTLPRSLSERSPLGHSFIGRDCRQCGAPQRRQKPGHVAGLPHHTAWGECFKLPLRIVRAFPQRIVWARTVAHGRVMRPLRLKALALATLAIFLGNPAGAQLLPSLRPDLSPEAYLAWSGGKLIAAGSTEIDGRRMVCGSSPTILDLHLSDFGASGHGFIVLNPSLFVGLPVPVKLWIFSHECAHQKVGADEGKADCVAVQRGRREKWLTESGLRQVCDFMKPARADSLHFSGPQRCEFMQRCFYGSEQPATIKASPDLR
jgi:hypothetical protein